ncbi:MAG: hypothetical protein WC627_13440 [Legionella sp.]|jgi:hypothetical protein
MLRQSLFGRYVVNPQVRHLERQVRHPESSEGSPDARDDVQRLIATGQDHLNFKQLDKRY